MTSNKVFNTQELRDQFDKLRIEIAKKFENNHIDEALQKVDELVKLRKLLSKAKHSKEYALYKGDKLLGIGTLVELAEMRGVSLKTMIYYSKPAYQTKSLKSKNTKGGFMIAIPLEDD